MGSPKVLVTYASRYGSTQEVAEAVAATLRVLGMEADCRPMREVRSLEEYSAVVLGTALYMFRLHKDARRFLARLPDALAARPAAIFVLGPFHNDEKEFQGARQQLEKELTNFPWFNPVDREVFGGKFDPAALRFPFNLVPVLRKMPASDIRDWEAIRAWAGDLATKLYPAVATASELAEVK